MDSGGPGPETLTGGPNASRARSRERSRERKDRRSRTSDRAAKCRHIDLEGDTHRTDNLRDADPIHTDYVMTDVSDEQLHSRFEGRDV